MHRRLLLEHLSRYASLHPDEARVVQDIVRFVEERPDCFLRSCREGHVTGSAWLVSAGHDKSLLVYHKKVLRWLQPGGHADGEPEVYRSALREAQEESGMWELELYTGDGGLRPLDVDVHAIPAHGEEPEHLHYDIRYLVVAAPGQEPRPAGDGDEGEARWFEPDELRQEIREVSVLRMHQKALRRLGARVD